MIYIPHPTFKFEEALGGHVIGCVNHYENFKQMILVDDHPFQYEKFHLLDPEKVYSKFEKAARFAQTRAWMAGPMFSFVREDGEEFAIRFLYNDYIDIIGYWTVKDDELSLGYQISKLLSKNSTVTYSRYPRSYYEFLEWLGDSLI